MKAEKYEMEAANDILREKNQPISTYTYAVVKIIISYMPHIWNGPLSNWQCQYCESECVKGSIIEYKIREVRMTWDEWVAKLNQAHLNMWMCKDEVPR